MTSARSTSAATAATLPRNCTFAPGDWQVLSAFWYPIAFSREASERPLGVTLLDRSLVVWRTETGLSVADDLCLHRGVPLSMGSVRGGRLTCCYHGFQYAPDGQCVRVPANPQAAIPKKLCLKTYPVLERYGLIWTCLNGDGSDRGLPEFPEWDDPDYQQILPEAIELDAAAGRQVEGFVDVAHFAWVHHESFADPDNPVVPDYKAVPTATGVRAEYLSDVSNFPKGLQHRAPEGFEWLRVFEVTLPFVARLTVHFPENGRLHILNAASPISARKTKVFVPICRNFDKDAPLEPVYEFNYQVFAEDKRIVERQCPEDLPLDISAEAHIGADRTSIAYRKALRALGLGEAYTT